MANTNCDIVALHDEVMASQNDLLRQGFFALIAELMSVQRELLEQKGYVTALLHDKVSYQNRLKEKELDEEKAKMKFKR